MSYIYVTDHKASIGIRGGFLVIKTNYEERQYPINAVDGISLFSYAQITTQCMDYCMRNSIDVSFFSSNGIYYGSLHPAVNTNITRLRKQLSLSGDNSFSVGLCRRIVDSKISNQIVVARRYGTCECTSEMIFKIKSCRKHVRNADSINSIRGYEGIASRYYFEILGSSLKREFAFNKRTRRPALDPFNAMLNMGYSILTKEILGEIENRGLSPYAGFLHNDHNNHPALASDLIEEWRPVIIDSTLLNLVQRGSVSSNDFIISNEGCRMNKNAIKKVISGIEMKLESKNEYLSYISRKVTFREAIWHQVERLGKAIDDCDSSRYIPVRIR